ncbi:MAG: chromate transporter [Anaerolineae bacterium]
MMLLLDLFLVFLQVGAFSFGGGYAMIPLVQEKVIRDHQWMSPQEFLDIVAVAQVTPGSIAVNAATYVGYRIAGVSGALVATLGVVLPSFVIILILALIFTRFQRSKIVQDAFALIRPAVLALIASAGLLLAGDAIVDWPGVLIAVVVFALIAFQKAHPIVVIVAAGVAGALFYS